MPMTIEGTLPSSSPVKRTTGTNRPLRYSARYIAASNPAGVAISVARPTSWKLP